jgi:hypothetical protein
VPTIIDRATCEAGQPNTLPIVARSACPHLMLATAKGKNITLKIWRRTVLLKTGNSAISLYRADNV